MYLLEKNCQINLIFFISCQRKCISENYKITITGVYEGEIITENIVTKAVN